MRQVRVSRLYVYPDKQIPQLLEIPSFSLRLQWWFSLSTSSFVLVCLGWNLFPARPLLEMKLVLTIKHYLVDVPNGVLMAGVTCSGRRQRVTTLRLEGQSLAGSLPPIGNLTFLRGLVLSNNHLHGTIPSDFGLLLWMRHLNLSTNSSNKHGLDKEQSGGADSFHFGHILTLLILRLGRNSPTGWRSIIWRGIPHDLSRLKCLKYLYLDVNNLSGMIPPSLYNWSSAIEFFVSGNILSGNFTPNMRFNFPQLRKFGIAGNQFTGIIPNTLSNISGLELLDLGNNYLTGQVPDSLGVLKDLYCTPTFGNETDKLALLAFKNYVVDVPNGVLMGGGYMQSPTSEGHNLEVGGSEISICHPSDIGHLPRMQHLNLSMNFIQGEIPIELTNCSSLRTVDLTRNNLTGQIPLHVGHMSKLQHLWLGTNNLSGTIPPSSIIAATDNHLSGNFMSNMRFSSLLRKFGIAMNQFTGIIPDTLSNISGLELLDLGENYLTGKIPDSLGVLKDLYWRKQNIWKHPKEIGNPINLIQFIATRNYLTGIIPTSIGKLQNLGELDFGWNWLSGEAVPSGGVLKLSFVGNPQLQLPPCSVVESAKHGKGKHPSIKIIIAISIAGVSCLAFIVASVLLYRRKKTIMKSSSTSLGYGYLRVSYNSKQLTPIVHGDLKPSNVLLYDDMVAHVGDFGLAKLLPEANDIMSSDQTSSRLMMGSIGYVAPEYGLGGSMWPQGDVYSYGILFLEMFTGKRPTEHMFSDGLSLHSFSKMALPERVMEIADSNLVGESGEAINNIANHGDVEGRMQHCLASIARIGVACSEESPGDRMDIKDVVMELNIIKEVFLGVGIHGERHIRMQLPAEGTSHLGGD
ncbi:hypothetical protein AAG906_020940 [Vitis piasezkii]